MFAVGALHGIAASAFVPPKPAIRQRDSRYPSRTLRAPQTASAAALHAAAKREALKAKRRKAHKRRVR
jgi:hypothetical protein